MEVGFILVECMGENGRTFANPKLEDCCGFSGTSEIVEPNKIADLNLVGCWIVGLNAFVDFFLLRRIELG